MSSNPSSEYRCAIITPNGKIFDRKVTALSATGTTGSFGVWAHHIPMVISLSRGPMTIRCQDKELFFAVSAGVLEVNKDSDVLLLADSAVEAPSYEQARETARNLLDNTLINV